MTTMLEKAARAACKQDARLHGWNIDRAWASQSDRYYDLAYAVLLAVKKPSDHTGGMVDAGYETMRHREVTTHKDARVCFIAMMDALLKDGKK